MQQEYDFRECSICDKDSVITIGHHHFYWPGCRRNVELFVCCCDACRAKKWLSGQSRTLMQPYVLGYPRSE